MKRSSAAQLSIFDAIPIPSPVVEVPIPAYAQPRVVQEHDDAIRNPKPGYERALVSILRGMAEYAEAHQKEHGSPIGEDHCIGSWWEAIGSNLFHLLNGERGGIDGGAFSTAINRLVEGEGSPESIKATAEALGVTTAQPVKSTPVATEAIGMRRLTERQRELLANVRVENNFAVYTPTERIPDWNELKSSMLALGGKWKTAGKKRPGGFEFPDDVDAAEAVRLALATGEILDAKAADFYPTSDLLADELAAYIDPQPGQRILEPSAGKGALALAIRRRCPESEVECVEALLEHRKVLLAEGFSVVACADFMELKSSRTYDGCIANPPFGRRNDIHHLTKAIGMLRPGGKLAAIASAGVAYRQDRLATDFRALVASHGGSIVENPDGSFKDAGTSVRTVRVLLTKGGN